MPAVIALFALMVGSSILLIGNGLQGLLIPVRADIEGFATSEIGLIAAAYSAGFIVGCVFNPRIIRRVGHIRSFAVFAAIGAAVILCHSLMLNPTIWFVLRLVSGICFSGLLTVIESWLNEQTTRETRGQVFGIYLFVNLSSVTAGMLILILGDAAKFDLFAVTAIAILLALVPVCLTTSKVPGPIADAQLRPIRLLKLSPVGVIACFVVGLANGSFAGLAPVFAGKIGMSTTAIAFFTAAAVVGGAFGQYPIGRISDYFDRRWVMIATCVGALVFEIAIVAVSLGWVAGDLDMLDQQVLLIFLSGLLGFFIFPIYGLAVAHTNDFAGDTSFVEVSSELLLTWGIGASIGPIVGSVAMSSFGPAGLFAWLAIGHIGLALFAVYRMAQREAPTGDDKGNFAPTLGQRVTPTSYGLHPQSEWVDDSPDFAVEAREADGG